MDLIRHDTNYDFLGKRKILLPISASLVVLILALVPFRINLGVDFAGGTEIEVKFDQNTSPSEVRQKIDAAGFQGAQVQQYGPESDHAFLVKVERISILTPQQAETLRTSLLQTLTPYGVQSIDFDPNVGDKIDIRTEKAVPLDTIQSAVAAAGVRLTTKGEAVRDLSRGTAYDYQVLTQGLSDKVSEALHSAFGEQNVDVRRVEYVGPQVGQQLRNKGIMAVLLSMLAMGIYIAFRFQPKFAPGAIVALIHDIGVVMGYYVLTGREFNLTSIAVLLTIVGYSINDTIVVYDRVREIEQKRTGKSLEEVINRAINETLSRTIITSGVTALSLVGLLIYGVGSIQDFAAAMMFGIVTGTYSSIYVAGPFALWYDNWTKRREERNRGGGKKPPTSKSPPPKTPPSRRVASGTAAR